MSFERSPKGEVLSSQALSKALVYFHNGGKRTFYSRDKTRKSNVPIAEAGIFKLRKMIDGWRDKIATAIIYDNVTKQELYKFKNGEWL